MQTRNIAKAGLLLSLLICSKMIEFALPDMPLGLGEWVPLFDLTLVICALLFEKRETFIATSVYILLFVWISIPFFLGGLMWVESFQTKTFVYLLDYLLPTLSLACISLARDKEFKSKMYWMLGCLLTMYLLHVTSGIIFWSSYAWSGYGPLAYSLVANAPKLFVLSTFAPLIIKTSKPLYIAFGKERNEQWS